MNAKRHVQQQQLLLLTTVTVHITAQFRLSYNFSFIT